MVLRYAAYNLLYYALCFSAPRKAFALLTRTYHGSRLSRQSPRIWGKCVHHELRQFRLLALIESGISTWPRFPQRVLLTWLVLKPRVRCATGRQRDGDSGEQGGESCFIEAGRFAATIIDKMNLPSTRIALFLSHRPGLTFLEGASCRLVRAASPT
jgi:hypothetical protein